MIATLSADIVRSTSLRTEDLIEMRNIILDFFDNLEEDYPGFWGRIVRGDGIECYIPEYHYALRIAILLKLLIKRNAGLYECADMLKKIGVRFSIGIGEVRYVNRTEGIIDGPSIYISGRNLDALTSKDGIYSIIEVEGVSREENCLLDSYISLISSIADSYSIKQTEVVYYKLLGFKEREISEKLGIFQSSVNTRSTSAQWGMLNTAIKDFEHFIFERICG